MKRERERVTNVVATFCCQCVASVLAPVIDASVVVGVAATLYQLLLSLATVVFAVVAAVADTDTDTE